MSVETKSLEMHRQFYGESTLITGMEGMMQFAGLETFINEIKRMTDKSSPLFSQAYLMFIYYKKQVLNFNNEALNNIAAKKLLGNFGEAGIGIDHKTGKVDVKITKQILKTHDELAVDVETTSKELPASVRSLSSLMATMQRKIVDLLIKSQENDLVELETKEEEEKKLERHLSKRTSTRETTIRESIETSVKSQVKRRKENLQEESGLSKQLKTLISFSKKVFTPVKQELRNMPMTA